MLDVLVLALTDVLSLQTLVFLLLGVVIGLIFGVIPGLGGTTALVILLPLTFGMDVVDAFAMSGGIMGAVAMGGSVPAILLNVPGTAPSAATCLDGYPLATQGRAAEALGATATACPLGGLVGVLTLLLILPVAKQLILLFGPPEFCLLAVFGILTVTLAESAQMQRSLLSAGIGLMLAFVGYDTVNGGIRFTYGSDYLWDGFPLVPSLVGLFGLPQMIHLAIKGGSIAADPGSVRLGGKVTGMLATFRHWKVVIRGSIIGTLVGAVPGAGGTVATFIAYATTKKADKRPDTFGTGRIEGIIAPEAANNAKDGGALLPTLAFGIPGSAEMAVFLGYLVLHGMQPGPTMLLQHEQEVYSLIIALTFSAVLASIIGLLCVRWLAMITSLNVRILSPIVIVISLLGAYTVNSHPGDAVIAGVLGVFGYLMMRFNYPRLPLVLALILGETAEQGFQQSMMISQGNWGIFLHSTASTVLVILIAATLAWPLATFLKEVAAGRKARQEAA